MSRKRTDIELLARRSRLLRKVQEHLRGERELTPRTATASDWEIDLVLEPWKEVNDERKADAAARHAVLFRKIREIHATGITGREPIRRELERQGFETTTYTLKLITQALRSKT